MRNPNANERLRAEFLRQYGKPLERVRGVRAARSGRCWPWLAAQDLPAPPPALFIDAHVIEFVK